MYNRLVNWYGENENYDYMRKFKSIIEGLKDNPHTADKGNGEG